MTKEYIAYQCKKTLAGDSVKIHKIVEVKNDESKTEKETTSK